MLLSQDAQLSELKALGVFHSHFLLKSVNPDRSYYVSIRMRAPHEHGEHSNIDFTLLFLILLFSWLWLGKDAAYFTLLSVASMLQEFLTNS